MRFAKLLILVAYSASSLLVERDYNALQKDFAILGNDASNCTAKFNSVPPNSNVPYIAFFSAQNQFLDDLNTTFNDCSQAPPLTDPQTRLILTNITQQFAPNLNTFLDTLVKNEANLRKSGIAPSERNSLVQLRDATNRISGCIVSKAAAAKPSIRASATAVSSFINALLTSAIAAYASAT